MPQHHNHPALGLSLRFLAVVLLTAMFTMAKLAGEQGVHIVEILFFRFVAGSLVMGVLVGLAREYSILKTKRFNTHIVRSLCGTLAMAFNFWGVFLLPLAEAAAISFTIPLLSTILSVVILSEVVRLKRWVAIITGFIGVLIITKAGQGDLPLFGIFIALTGAFFTACTIILVRDLARTEDSRTIVFWDCLLSIPIGAVAMIWVWQAHPPMAWFLLAGIAFIGAFGQLATAESLRYASISVVAPVDYLSLFFSVAYGYWIWNYWPGLSLWLGAPLIIGAALYVAFRERQLMKSECTIS